jgi:hypothetical protein
MLHSALYQTVTADVPASPRHVSASRRPAHSRTTLCDFDFAIPRSTVTRECARSSASQLWLRAAVRPFGMER